MTIRNTGNTGKPANESGSRLASPVHCGESGSWRGLTAVQTKWLVRIGMVTLRSCDIWYTELLNLNQNG